jgi:hypothetical protein
MTLSAHVGGGSVSFQRCPPASPTSYGLLVRIG